MPNSFEPLKRSIAATNTKFNTTGITETAKNLFKEFKIPDISEVKDIKIKYGNVILVSMTTKSNFVLSSAHF